MSGVTEMLITDFLAFIYRLFSAISSPVGFLLLSVPENREIGDISYFGGRFLEQLQRNVTITQI
jgi:hypothetical protein